MNFLFLDESGTPSFNDQHKIFCIIGLDIDDSKEKLLTYEFNLLKHHYFPQFYRTPLRSLPNISDKINLLKRRECKEMLTPNEFCYPHRTFLFKTINLCVKYNVKVLNVTAFKDKLRRRDPDWLYPACIKIITRIYNYYLSKKGTRGMMIMDSRGELLNDTMTFIQSSFLLWGKEGKLFDKIIELPFFTPSHLSAVLQIAHYFSYITAMQYNYIVYNQTKYAYLTPLWQELSCLFYGTPKGKDIIYWA